jgi:uncharacterized protein with HEPN domain
MPPEDRIRLRHILDAAREALSYVQGRQRRSLDTDRMLVHSIVRCVEIIGEAANNLSEETRQSHPAIPWPKIIAMRNRLIHAYFDVDLDRVWDTATLDLPPLIARFEAILAQGGT